MMRRVAQHIFAIVEALSAQAKPGEEVKVAACGLELYNEELRDLSLAPGSRDGGAGPKAGFGSGAERAGMPALGAAGMGGGQEIKIAERMTKDGRVVTEVGVG
jgi:kinesin family protein 4/21/27